MAIFVRPIFLYENKYGYQPIKNKIKLLFLRDLSEVKGFVSFNKVITIVTQVGIIMKSKKHNDLLLSKFNSELENNIFKLTDKLREHNWTHELFSRSNIVEAARIKKGKANVCHIIGSGSSLNKSKHIINDSDFVIGFNYAALADIKWDIYFFEFGGRAVLETSKRHLAIAEKLVCTSTDLVFFKNLWESKNELEFVEKYWLDFARPVKDVLYPTVNKEMLPYSIKRCFEANDDFLPQFKSSMMTSIFLAYQAGFKEIVLHGLDFGGLYFYEEYLNPMFINYAPHSAGELGNYEKSEEGSIHITAQGINSMRNIIPMAKEYLMSNKCKLYSATHASSSAEILPVFNNHSGKK